MAHKSNPKSQEDYLITPKNYSSLVSCEPDDLIWDYFGRMWKYTKNPLFVWVGIKACYEYNIDFPEWIKKYLYECSANLTIQKPIEGKRGAFFISKALKMNKSGQGSVFKSFHKFFEDYSIFLCYFDRKDQPGKLSDEKISDELSDIFFSSADTIRDRLKKFFKTFIKAP